MALNPTALASRLVTGSAWWKVLRSSLLTYAVFHLVSFYVVGKLMGPPEFFNWWWQRVLDAARWLYELFSSKQAATS